MPQPLPIWGSAGNGFDTFHPQAAAKKKGKTADETLHTFLKLAYT